MTDDLNKQWAELEGCDLYERIDTGHGDFDEIEKDWTEPNRFFADVDKKMNQTHALKLERSYGNQGEWVATYLRRGKWSVAGCIYCWADNPCEAALNAAIQARKGLRQET